MQPLLASDPAKVGDYRLLARIGGGAMGAVYLARSRGGRVVAIKVARPELAEDAEFRERFRREVDMARSVGGFWTAAVVDAEPDAEQPWLATEYVPGPTLHSAVSDHGALPEPTVRSLAAGLAEALSAIHRAGLVHRDLKPGNVLLGPDGPRVIDFGISRAVTNSALTATGIFLGTPGYFSPEQTTGSDVGPPSDVFSLGAVLVFAAGAAGPFGSGSAPVMLYRVVHNHPDLSALSPGLRSLLGPCLAKEPAERPTPDQLLDAIGATSPQGDNWLPPAISAVINEHTTQLKQASEAAFEMPLPGGAAQNGGTAQSSAAHQGGNRGTAFAQPPGGQAVPGSAAFQAGTPSNPGSRPRGDWSAAPPQSRNPNAGAAPAAQTKRPPAPKAPEPSFPSSVPRKVSANTPGPVFVTGGRGSALLWAVLMFVVAAFAYTLGDEVAGNPVPTLAFLLFFVSGLLSLAKAVLPGLRLKVNTDGLRISRAGLAREIPWHEVRRVGIVGKGKRQALTVWLAEHAPPQRWHAWHPVRRMHGGVQMFPLGATGGPITRRQETHRVREALQQYGRGTYDRRLS